MARERLRLFFQRMRKTKKIYDDARLQRMRFFFQRYRLIGQITREAQREINRATAPEFSVFEYFWCHETRLSKVISDLLNPNGRHGQGDLFLEMFLRRINLELPEHDQLDVTRLGETKTYLEVATDRLKNTQRRIDIAVINPCWVLGIENKPWALDQENQISDYRLHLERAYPGRPCRMIYVPGNCSKPRNDTTDPETIIIGYNYSDEKCGPHNKHAHLSDWLDEAAQACRVDKIRYFLSDFALWIRNSFNNQAQETGHREISHEHVRHSFQ